MTEFVSDCPRCGAKRATFDVFASVTTSVQYDWKYFVEVYCVCRTCHKSSVQLVTRKDLDRTTEKYFGLVRARNTLPEYRGSLNDLVNFERFVTLRDISQDPIPEYLPDQIEKIISEANLCFSVGCYNAAAAMYRLALDIATKGLVPSEPDQQPSAPVMRNLGLRIAWLLQQGLLPNDLKRLAAAVRENGNDGAHDGTLSKDDAEDVKDFCIELARRLFTEPERIRLAEARRENRKKL